MESKVLNLRLETSECATLDKLAGKALNRQAVARMLLIAAIEAVQANGNMVHLPPKFAVADESPFLPTRFNEPIPHKKRP
jgi:hypothetical protein